MFLYVMASNRIMNVIFAAFDRVPLALATFALFIGTGIGYKKTCYSYLATIYLQCMTE